MNDIETLRNAVKTAKAAMWRTQRGASDWSRKARAFDEAQARLAAAERQMGVA